jgi:hypothetical protein
MTYDFYRGKKDHSLRMATAPDAGLPSHVEPTDWELMPTAVSQLIEDVDIDIADRGFSFFRSR